MLLFSHFYLSNRRTPLNESFILPLFISSHHFLSAFSPRLSFIIDLHKLFWLTPKSRSLSFLESYLKTDNKLHVYFCLIFFSWETKSKHDKKSHWVLSTLKGYPGGRKIMKLSRINDLRPKSKIVCSKSRTKCFCTSSHENWLWKLIGLEMTRRITWNHLFIFRTPLKLGPCTKQGTAMTFWEKKKLLFLPHATCQFHILIVGGKLAIG